MDNSKVFLKNSKLDTNNYYLSLLNNGGKDFWDVVVITASNSEQAKIYEKQINYRIKNKLLPLETKYMVISDPDGKRVGSGGATLNVLKVIFEKFNDSNFFRKNKILVIHSGGDSKRVPQFSACGKLFSPIPKKQINNNIMTLFDELIISFSILPIRMDEGIMILSGDAILSFNYLQADLNNKKVAALSMKEKVSVGKNHGVFLTDTNNQVVKFLHKLSEEELKRLGAIKRDYIDLDTGAVYLSSEVVENLMGLFLDKDKINLKKFNFFVNDEVQLNFYGDFLYPMGIESSLEEYLNKREEKEVNKKIKECRIKLWETLNKYNIDVIKLFPAEFIHFGTSRELLNMMTKNIDKFSYMDWANNILSNVNLPKFVTAINSYVDPNSSLSEEIYLENSMILGKSKINKKVILSNTIISDLEIPSGVCISTLKLSNGKYVSRIYGVDDNPKNIYNKDLNFLNFNFKEFIDKYNIDLKEIWDEEQYLWFANLYVSSLTKEESVKKALDFYKIISLEANQTLVEDWLKSKRYSLYSSFNLFENNSLLKEQENLKFKITLFKIKTILSNKENLEKAISFINKLNFNLIKKELLDQIDSFDFSLKIRTYYFLFLITQKYDNQNLQKNIFFDNVFSTIREATKLTSKEVKRTGNLKEQVVVKMPVRVNFAGGWSDTPPYCFENGGTVLNAAISLNGKLPIEVKITKLKEPKIVLVADDFQTELNNLKEVYDLSNIKDSFLLFKACLLVSGYVSDKHEKLKSGILIESKTHNIPKGSGLGTSSILAGAMLKALHQFMNNKIDDYEICNQTLVVEQMMSTGGGWQDQVGGIFKGMKLITTTAGFNQNYKIKKIRISKELKKQFNQRFVLIYTGQRRLARNLLRDIVLKYISGSQNTKDIIDEIQRIAILMAFELEKENFERFVELMNKQWEYSIKLDSGSTNLGIERIIESCSDLISGKIIIGAGGGGFIGVVLKENVKKQQIKKRIDDNFQDSGVEVYNSKIIY